MTRLLPAPVEDEPSCTDQAQFLLPFEVNSQFAIRGGTLMSLSRNCQPLEWLCSQGLPGHSSSPWADGNGTALHFGAQLAHSQPLPTLHLEGLHAMKKGTVFRGLPLPFLFTQVCPPFQSF